MNTTQNSLEGGIKPGDLYPGNDKSFTWLYYTLGFIMLGGFIHCLWRGIEMGTIQDIFWMSNFGTLVGGIGAICQSRYLISMTLVGLTVFHSWWLTDVVTWLIIGKFPLGVATYVESASLGAWIQSINHFYTVPSLLILTYLKGGVSKRAWIGATCLFTILVLIGFFFLPPDSNVNSAHRVWPGLDQMIFKVFNGLPPVLYLICLISLNMCLNFFPVNLLLDLFFTLLTKKRRLDKENIVCEQI